MRETKEIPEDVPLHHHPQPRLSRGKASVQEALTTKVMSQRINGINIFVSGMVLRDLSNLCKKRDNVEFRVGPI
jgi:hypothetical protein